MSDRHVVPAEDGWHVEKDHAQRASAKTPTQAEAIARAVEIVANDGGGQVIVHGNDGEVRENRTIAAGDPHTTGTAVAAATEAAATGAQVTAGAAAEELADTAQTLADEAGDAATSSADHIGVEQAERSAGQVREETAAAASRVEDRVAATVAEGARAARKQVDRAAVAGAGVGKELDSAADRTGRRIHATTESLAAPLDHLSDDVLDRVGALSRVLNPVRVTGRVVGATVALGLYTASLVPARGTRAVQRTVHASTEGH